mgnify:CR=1 FL=1
MGWEYPYETVINGSYIHVPDTRYHFNFNFDFMYCDLGTLPTDPIMYYNTDFFTSSPEDYEQLDIYFL